MKNLIVLSAAVLALVAAIPAMASAQAAGEPAERFVLSGVVAFDNGDGKAWLQEPSITRDQIVVVRRGDSVGPYRVTAILRNRVELEGPGGAIVVPLSNAGGKGMAATGSAAPPAAAPAAAAKPVPLGHPSRREAIANLTGMLQQGAQPLSGGSGGVGASGGSAARTDSNRSLPDFSAQPSAPSTGPAKTIQVGVGDPRRRQAIQQLFGPR